MNPEEREKHRIYMNEWRLKNPEKVKEIQKIHAPIYYQENRDKILARLLPYREILTEKSNCELCCQEKDEKLVVHHKDKDRKNNDKNNLMVLHASCHSKLHNPVGIKFGTRGG